MTVAQGDPNAQLQRDLLAAHAARDTARLPALYNQAGLLREAAGDIDAACFFFTLAYVYGLDAGDDETAASAHARLVAHGRER